MLVFFLSAFASAILLGVSLLITRRRLARQFQNIEQRQNEIERAIEKFTPEIELEIKRCRTTDAQLERLHLGLVRIQENMARRHDALLSQFGHRQLTGLQSAALEEWAGKLGVKLADGGIEEWLRAVERAEAFEPRDVPIETPDLLALVVALLGESDRHVTIGVAGASAGSLASVLPRVLSGHLDQMDVRELPKDSTETKPLDFLILDDTFPFAERELALNLVKGKGTLILHSVPDVEGMPLDAFEMVGAEWKTRVYRKCA